MTARWDPRNWFWIVAGDQNRVYSSAVNRYVPIDDAAYQSFLGTSALPTRITSEADLAEVLRHHAPGLVPDWLFSAPSFVQPSPDAYGAAQLKAYAADARWRREVAGIAFAGIAVATDDRSKQMLMGARIAAEADADFTTKWAAVDGTVHDLDAAEIIALSNAVLAHVNACFIIYSALVAQIESGAITTTEAVDAAMADIDA